MTDPISLFITIDLENMNTPLAHGRYSESLVRLDILTPMLEAFDRHGVKAVFFASVFEHCRFGKDAVATLLRHLDACGHDVQLHTHPGWCYGREHMWQYDPAEQEKIIRDGCRLLQEWIGKAPVAHRAGAYGINEDTLAALEKNGVFIDASMFRDHDNCKLDWGANRIVKHGPMMEIPVTGFYKDHRIGTERFNVRYRRRFVKTDINWCTLDELCRCLDQVKRLNTGLFTLFMHSYSLAELGPDFNYLGTDRSSADRLEKFLDRAANDPGVQFRTMTDFWQDRRVDPPPPSHRDHPPRIDRFFSPKRLIERRLRRAKAKAP